MHNLVFGLKRLHLTAERHIGAALRSVGLTPARYDVLQLLADGAQTQSELRKLLGVARSTISKMLTSMERRGLIRRWGNAAQRARKRVRMTDETFALFLRLRGLSHDAIPAAFAFFFAMGRYPLRRYTPKISAASEILRMLRERSADRATALDPYYCYELGD